MDGQRPVLPLEGPSTPDDSAAVAERDGLERAYRRLTLEQRAVFVINHDLGLPWVEVAELLGIPAGPARSRFHSAIAGLRDALTAETVPIVQETARMTDGRSPDRRSLVHRTWPDPGTGARRRGGDPDHQDDTPGVGDLRIPGRFPTISLPARVAAAAVIGVLVIGGATFLLGRTGKSKFGGPSPTLTHPLPTASSSTAKSTLTAYRAGRDAVYTTASASLNPLKTWFVGVFDETLTLHNGTTGNRGLRRSPPGTRICGATCGLDPAGRSGRGARCERPATA
ncbi:MAG TPA: hypothetical protein VM427_03970 [Patescibacteria group bacterium]|nr:hypothetical protein [Patescibacteria group bacterium]